MNSVSVGCICGGVTTFNKVTHVGERLVFTVTLYANLFRLYGKPVGLLCEECGERILSEYYG